MGTSATPVPHPAVTAPATPQGQVQTPGDTTYLPERQRHGISLSLSGGGFRATLFHLGALRRLNELGILEKLDAITSVSGGSMMAMCLADAIMARPLTPTAPCLDFTTLEQKVHALTSYNLRRTILLKRILPQHWRDPLVELVAKELASHVNDQPLSALPDHPRFTFCATDMAFGVNWTFQKDRMGDYQAGYSTTGLDTFPIARAVAASACFPPIFEPMDPKIDPAQLHGGKAQGNAADRCRHAIQLTDGGVYDNMGIEPVWKTCKTVLVSDASGEFEYTADRGTLSDIKRYPDIMGNQAHALRRRWLIASFMGGPALDGTPALAGTYWATSGNRARYDANDRLGYSDEFAQHVIANIRTDLDAFSPAETAVLENHGYLMADIAIRTHVPGLNDPKVPCTIPHPQHMDEDAMGKALEDSAKQRL